MKLLYIHQYFAFPDIHSSTRSYDLATSFVNEGVEVIVLTTTTKIKGVDQSRRWNVFTREGIQFYVLTSNYSQSRSPLMRILLFIQFMYFASVRALRIKCDVLFATSTPITVAIPALIKRLIHHTPYIFEVRDVWPEIPIKMGYIRNPIIKKILYALESQTYKKAKSIVVLSEGMKKSIEERYNTTKCTVIPNISEINRFQHSIIPVDLDTDALLNKKIILYAGAFGRVNGIMYVANLALQIFKYDSEIIFFLVGVGNEKERITQFCRAQGIINQNVYIFDPVPKQSLPYLYSICKIGSSFVIDNPVLWNNSANKFFDTLAAGKPILINYEGWQADVIRREDIGYVLPQILNDDEIQRFVRYINDSEKLKIQGLNALALAKNEYSLEVAKNRYLEILKSIN